MNLTVVTRPTVEPVTLAEMKLHLRVDHVEEDGLIAGLIKAARQHVETVLNRTLLTTTWKLTADCFPDYFELPRPPVQSVSSVVYLDQDGASQTLATTEYLLDTFAEPARLTTAYQVTWPQTRWQYGAVAVTYVAGYTSAGLVPETVKAAIKLLVDHWFNHRGAASEVRLESVPQAVDALLWGERVLVFA